MWRRALVRSALLSTSLWALSVPAAAGWEGPWAEKPFWERSEAPKKHKQVAAPKPVKAPKAVVVQAPVAAKAKAKPVVAQTSDDDDDDAPKAKKGKVAAAKAKPEVPEVVQGGARPDIAPKAPETVAFGGSYPVGSIVIDTAGRKLYYVKAGGMAFRYPIAVGKVGFTWTGTEQIARKQEWPDWVPPAEMRERKPELPERMTGGINNPLGAMALYLGNSLYRIHGTSDASSIGTASSSGCFRMHNAHVVHLSSLAGVGTQVTVLKNLPSKIASAD